MKIDQIISDLKNIAADSTNIYQHVSRVNGITGINTNFLDFNCQNQLFPTIHAEIRTLQKLLNNHKYINSHKLRRQHLDMYIVRVRKDTSGNIFLANSMPCKSCFHALRTYFIRRIYFSTDSGEIKCVKIAQVSEDIFHNNKHQVKNNNICRQWRL